MKKSIRKPRKIIVEDIKAEVTTIKRLAVIPHNYEYTHMLEDLLHSRVLRLIAGNEVVDPKACANMALSTHHLKFLRSYSQI